MSQFHNEFISLNDATDLLTHTFGITQQQAYRILQNDKIPVDSQERKVKYIIPRSALEEEIHFRELKAKRSR